MTIVKHWSGKLPMGKGTLRGWTHHKAIGKGKVTHSTHTKGTAPKHHHAVKVT